MAHCHLPGEPRTFAVERIRAMRRTGLHFVRPRDFDAEAYFRDSWGIIRGDRVTVRLRFSPGQANYIAERLWHPTQEFQWLSDGRLDLSLKVADTLDLQALGAGLRPRGRGRGASRPAGRDPGGSRGRLPKPGAAPPAPDCCDLP